MLGKARLPELVPLKLGRPPSLTAGFAIHGFVGISRADFEPAPERGLKASREPAPVATSEPKLSLGTFDTAAEGAASEDTIAAGPVGPSDGAFALIEAAPAFFAAAGAADVVPAVAAAAVTGAATALPRPGGPAAGLRPAPLAEELEKRWRGAGGTSSAVMDVAGPPLVRRGVASAYADDELGAYGGGGASPFFEATGTPLPLPARRNLCLAASCASDGPPAGTDRRAVDAPLVAERGVGVGVAEGGWRGSKCAAR